jgi:GNAT superfamily N-acetyltransferase
MIGLRPLRADEFDAWLARSRARYADDMVANAGMTTEAAQRKAELDAQAVLSAGIATPGHHLLVVEDGDGRAVGTLWFAVGTSHEGVARAYLYEVEIDEARRGEGLGRAAMEALEERVRALGYDRIELNVFGGNGVARSLYASLGYAETAVHMAKEL